MSGMARPGPFSSTRPVLGLSYFSAAFKGVQFNEAARGGGGGANCGGGGGVNPGGEVCPILGDRGALLKLGALALCCSGTKSGGGGGGSIFGGGGIITGLLCSGLELFVGGRGSWTSM